jgi:hypothetical protein
MARIPNKAPEAAQVPDLSRLQDESIDREFRKWAEYWLGRYLSPKWDRACAAWELNRRANPEVFTVRPEILADAERWADAKAESDNRRPTPGAIAACARRMEIEQRLREAWPDCAWSRVIVERFREKVRNRIARGWKVFDRGVWREPTLAEQVEQLVWSHAEQAAKAGIIPSREEIRARMCRPARAKAERRDQISPEERERRARDTAEAIV